MSLYQAIRLYLHMRFSVLFIFLLVTQFSNAQNIQRLWNQKDYEAIYAQRDRVNRMSGLDMLRVAQSAQHFEEDSIAIDILDLSIEKGYADAQTYYIRGISLIRLKLYLGAADSFHQALALNRNRLPYMLAKADAYYRGEEPDSALAVFERVHTLFPGKDVATFMMCKIPEEEGFSKKAVECYKLHIPEIAEEGYKLEAKENLAMLQWRHVSDTSAAEENLLQLAEAKPQNFRYKMLLCQLYGETKNWEQLELQRNAIHTMYQENKIPSRYFVKNMFPLFEVEGENYRIQVFEILNPAIKGGTLFKAFYVTPTQAMPVGSIAYAENEGGAQIIGEGQFTDQTTTCEPMKLQELIFYMERIESKM